MAKRLDIITQAVGFTLWQLQALEGATASLFVLLTQISKGMPISECAILLDKAQAKTFGTTIHHMAQSGALSSNLVSKFRKVLAERNWLVHGSRATSRNAIYHASAMDKLLSRLEAIQAESDYLMNELVNITVKFAAKHGVSQEDLLKNANSILEQWQKADDI